MAKQRKFNPEETGKERTCVKCGETKSLLDFPINNTFDNRIQRKHSCMKCRSKQSKVRAQLYKKHKKPKQITCPICQRQRTDVVMDHDHDTNVFRGWLCNDCNNALGKFSDDIVVLQRAIQYLQPKP